MNYLWVLIPLTAIVAPFVFIIIVIIIRSRDNRIKNSLKAELFAKALEKGAPIPEDFFKETKKKSNNLQTGILLLSIGIGLGLFLTFASDLEDATVALLPICMGVGFIIIHYITSRNEKKEESQ